MRPGKIISSFETEVAEENCAIRIYKDIIWVNSKVENILSVSVFQCAANLLCDSGFELEFKPSFSGKKASQRRGVRSALRDGEVDTLRHLRSTGAQNISMHEL